MFKKKKSKLTIMEEVKLDVEIKSKRMDPFLKRRIKSFIFGIVFFLFVLTIILIQPRDEYVKKDKREEKYITYSKIISNIHKNGFVYDEKNNPEGYIKVGNYATYLIKIFYKENYLDADQRIYAYTSYYDQTGIVINEEKEKYKVYFYNNNSYVMTDKDGLTTEYNINYINNKELIINIIKEIQSNNEKIFIK